MDVAECLIEKGNKELKAIIAGKKNNGKKELTSAQVKTDMGLCRKHNGKRTWRISCEKEKVNAIVDTEGLKDSLK